MSARLPDACLRVEEEVAADILQTMLAVNRAIGLLHQANYNDYWAQALQTVCELADTAPLLSGFAFRLRFDKKILPLQAAADALQFHLSTGQSPRYGARWLDGFLQGSSLL